MSKANSSERNNNELNKAVHSHDLMKTKYRDILNFLDYRRISFECSCNALIPYIHGVRNTQLAQTGILVK